MLPINSDSAEVKQSSKSEQWFIYGLTRNTKKLSHLSISAYNLQHLQSYAINSNRKTGFSPERNWRNVEHTLENWICNQRCVEFSFLEGEKMKEIKDKVMEDCRLTKKNDNGLKTNSVPTPSTLYICLFSVHYEFLVVSVLISLCPFHRLHHVLLRFPSNFLEL